jgi:hypothetical protein
VAWNFWYCLSLLSAGIKGMLHHTQLLCLLGAPQLSGKSCRLQDAMVGCGKWEDDGMGLCFKL